MFAQVCNGAVSTIPNLGARENRFGSLTVTSRGKSTIVLTCTDSTLCQAKFENDEEKYPNIKRTSSSAFNFRQVAFGRKGEAVFVSDALTGLRKRDDDNDLFTVCSVPCDSVAVDDFENVYFCASGKRHEGEICRWNANGLMTICRGMTR